LKRRDIQVSEKPKIILKLLTNSKKTLYNVLNFFSHLKNHNNAKKKKFNKPAILYITSNNYCSRKTYIWFIVQYSMVDCETRVDTERDFALCTFIG